MRRSTIRSESVARMRERNSWSNPFMTERTQIGAMTASATASVPTRLSQFRLRYRNAIKSLYMAGPENRMGMN